MTKGENISHAVTLLATV